MAKILLTGGSSFSGLWIAQALAAAGHQVSAAVTRPRADYQGLRAERVARLETFAQVVYEAPIASPAFLSLVQGGHDLLAHHAADIPNYRSASYDPVDGFVRNIAGVEAVLDAFADAGGRAVVATGTAFEAGEGGPEGGDLAVSPYGLSKSLTNETVRHMARWRGLRFGKFVVAGPFGPLEEGRMVWSLMQRWFEGEAGVVRTPRYVRDNIPVPLLAHAYVRLAETLLDPAADTEAVARPSGFVGTQEAFARRLAAAMAPRLALACEIDVLPQPDLAEPLVRVNDQPWLPGWEEAGFWDDYAAYYQRVAASGLLSAPA
ncbi:MAG: NAD(P)-dependent oxidoreductase [Phenylobacterium sp.]|uniref:NAD-dependent epimerase/dehydratase family protein n=1 Tax=Phenylobacterium sp. TaxID=1871053 RepID=UPI0025E94CA9|nr:NAD(P)-dependent oxidoreductase [Phenylobacterium sp.]MBA4010735.1 NAD(P)-dependent oxidoreductase [Phenylobacterium sp.]